MTTAAAQVKFKVNNLTTAVSNPSTGISFVMAVSERGPFATPNEIINTWSRFKQIYGGLLSQSDGIHKAKRLLEKGGSVRFSRIGHYTDITDNTTLDAVKALPDDDAVDGVNELFELVLKNPGADGNFFQIEITAASNGDPDYFDIYLTHIKDNSIAESYINLKIDNTPNIAESTYLKTISQSSQYLDVVYKDLSGFVSPLSVDPVSIGFNGGTDGMGGVKEVSTIQVTAAATAVGNASVELDGVTIQLPLTIDTINNNAIEIQTVINALPDWIASVNTDTITITAVTDGIKVNIANYQAGTATTSAATLITTLEGVNVGLPSATDYSGDSAAGNGFHAFDNWDDTLQIMILDPDTVDSVHIAGAAYATSREDLIYFIHLSNNLITKASIVAKRVALNIDTKYVAFFAGGLKTTDPSDDTLQNIEATADIAALASASDNDFGPWYSFAGHTRGQINNTLGVVNNFGSPAKRLDLDDLAKKQINMIINRSNKIMLWGNFSGQLANNQESQLSITRLVIFLKKALKPTIETFIEEPNDIPTWKRMFYTVKPFLDGLVTKRALFEYTWQGDQDAPNLNTLVVNNAADVTLGKYQVQLGIKAIPSIQEIVIVINLTTAGVDFEIVQ